MLVRHSRPAAYLVSSPLFASLLESLFLAYAVLMPECGIIVTVIKQERCS